MCTAVRNIKNNIIIIIIELKRHETAQIKIAQV